MFRKIKAYLHLYILTAILLPTLIVLADIANNSFTPLDPQFDSPFTPENSPKSMRELWNPAMAGPESCPIGYESPFIPLKYYAERGTRSFFIRGEKYFPIDPSKCSDLVLDRMGMVECLKRHGIKPEDLPPIKPPPNYVPPLPPDAERLFFSIRGEGRFKAPPRISPEGKVGHPVGEPSWWRAIGLRLSPDFLQALEASLSNYLSNNINNDANNICDPAGGSSYRYRRNADNTCTDLQYCASSGSGSGPCGSLVSCPASTCSPSSSACANIPMAGDCATKDTFPCDTNGACAVVANDNKCIYIGTPIDLELADCSNIDYLFCPQTSSCGDDGLIVDVNVPGFELELFMRVVNYIPTPAHCNSSIVEHRCGNCGPATDCCPDAEMCGVAEWCGWFLADGCPCCDDYIRLRFGVSDIWAYNIAFLFYGPNSAPFMTPCGSPATQFHGGHPGEWIDLCACNQDVSFSNYDSEFCNWGICGALVDFIENLQRDNVRCTISRQLNSLLSGALKSFLAGVFPLSAMELLGACSTNAYHIGIYPEICAGSSLGYPRDYRNGGAGLVLFLDMTWQLGTASSCVAGGPCPMYPTSVPSTSCKTNPQTCLPASGYHIGIYVDQELINELFYVFWSQGLLCYTFTLSPDQAWMLIPGIRQVVGSPTAVEVSFIPVCNPTPQFSTSGGTFTLTIPRFYLRFRTAGGTQLFDVQMRMTISGQLGYNTTTCHPLDPLCGSTFRCKRCYSWGCQDEFVQYGPGYLQITNITIDPVVEAIVNRHPAINATPPYTEIADVIAVLLDGLIDQTAIRTRIYNLLGLLPLKMDLPGFFIGFMNNALVARLTLPTPLCINFILEFGQFSPQIGLASSEFSEIPPDFQIAPKPKVETIVVPEENGRISPENINYQEEKREYVINSDEPIRFKVKSKIDKFYPDQNSSVELLWRYEGGYMWHKIENGEFYLKPVSEITVEIFTAVRHTPSGVYTIVDENPVKIKVKKGIQGKIEGPDKLRPGELGVFEVKADYENLEISYGIDDGDFTRFLPTRTIKLRFEEGGKHTLKVILKSGEKYGVVSKEIEVEGEPAKGCGGPGLPFGLSLTGIFAVFFLTIGKRKKVKNGKNNFFFFSLLFFLFFFISFFSFSCGGSKSNPNSDPNFKILEFGPQGENLSADASIFVRFSNKATDFSFSITPYVKLTPYWYDESNILKLVPDGGLELSTKYSVYVEGKSVKSNSRASVMWEFKTATRPQGSQAGPQISIQSGCFKDKLIFNISSTSTISFSVYVNSNLVKKDTLGYGSKDVQIEQGFTEGKNDLAVEIINLVDGSRIKYTFQVTKDTVPPKEPGLVKISRAEFSIKEPEDSGCGVDQYNLYEIIEGNQVLLGGVVAEKNLFDTYFIAFQKSKICITAVDKAYNESGCSNVEEQGFEKLSINFGAPVSYPIIKDKKLFFISDGKLFVYDGQAPKETGFSCNKIFGLPDGNIACESQGEVFVISETSSKKLYSGQLMAACERDFAVSDGKSVRIYNANFEINQEINIEGVESLDCADIDKDGEIELIMGIPKEDKIYMERLDLKNFVGRSDTISAGEGNLIIINKGSKFGSFIESIEKPEPKIFVLAPEWDLNYAYRKISEAEGEKPSETNVDFGTASMILVISPFNQNQIYDLIYTNIKGARKFRLFEDKFILWLTNSGLIVDFHISKRFSQIKLLENVLDIAVGDIDGDGNKDIIATTENSIEIFR